MDNTAFKKDIKQLKECLSHQNVDIPSFWSCLWPGVLMMLWIILCPVIAMQMYIYTSLEELQAVSGGVFVGAIYAFLVFDVRSKFLAIPKEVRIRLGFFRMLSAKLKLYYLAYGVVVAVAAFFTRYTNFPAFLYVAPLLIAVVLSMSIGFMDLSRYGVSVIVSLLQQIQSRKQGGE